MSSLASGNDHDEQSAAQPSGLSVPPRNLTHCATCDQPFPEPMTHWDDYFVEIEDAAFVCESCPEVFDD